MVGFKRSARVLGLFLLAIGTVAGCSSGDSSETTDESTSVSSPETTTSTTSAPTTTTEVVPPVLTLSEAFSDDLGYTYHLDLKLYFEDGEIDETNAPPGFTDVYFTLRQAGSIRNTTEGRTVRGIAGVGSTVITVETAEKARSQQCYDAGVLGDLYCLEGLNVGAEEDPGFGEPLPSMESLDIAGISSYRLTATTTDALIIQSGIVLGTDFWLKGFQVSVGLMSTNPHAVYYLTVRPDGTIARRCMGTSELFDNLNCLKAA